MAAHRDTASGRQWPFIDASSAEHRLANCYHVRQCRYIIGFATPAGGLLLILSLSLDRPEPHIGHLHSLLVADVLTRFQKLLNPSVVPLFCTGTDEHGSKVHKAATENRQQPKDFCDSISKTFVNLAESFNCEYSQFIRTTDQKHAQVVQTVWKKLFESGHIYKAKYEGWYCLSDESFVTTYEERVIDGQTIKVSPESGHPVEWQSETNYMFRLSSFKDELTRWVTSNANVISPSKFHHYLESILNNFVWNDLSISRPASRLSWGIPVPDDPSHTIYVWLDALVNYLTVAGYPAGDKMSYWPPDVQVIGKDIIKFHAIYWPCFLLALGLPMPRKLLVHSHWTVDSIKMSKSLGNVVNPLDLKDEYLIDGVRYYLMRASSLTDDGNFSLKVMKRIVNSELADTLGNLLSRACAPSINPLQIYPSLDAGAPIASAELAEEIKKSLENLPMKAFDSYNNAQFNFVVDEVMAILRMSNLFFHQQAPWKMVKDSSCAQEVERTLFTCFEVLRVTSIVLSPIVPTVSANILNRLNVPLKERSWHAASLQFQPQSSSHSLSPDKTIVYTRVK